jgi:hypothetical protein
MDYDAQKDARRDAEHVISHPRSPGGNNAVLMNLARCYLAMREVVADRCCQGCATGVLGRTAPELEL